MVETAAENGISVLVPVYNWDSSTLLSGLHEQGLRLMGEHPDAGFELIVADDCSTNAAMRDRVAETVRDLSCCRYFPLERNLGRAAVRNFLAGMARFDRLLFIDCDAQICSGMFLEDYLTASETVTKEGNAVQVVCGGLKHPASLPAAGMELRYRYERKADRKRQARYRSLEPYDRFTPFSFLIYADCFRSIRFDESISEYGYEDVIFGMELKRRNVPVLHIDNPLVHMGLEDNRSYLAKTETAIRNLYGKMDGMNGGSSLLNCYRKLERLHLTGLVLAMGKCLEPCITANLTGRHPSLLLFSFFKLYRLAALFRSVQSPAD